MKRKHRTRYEVLYRRDGRWLSDSVVEVADTALVRANTLLSGQRVQAVRVMRTRRTASGIAIETAVFERTADRKKFMPTAIALAELPDEEIWCETIGDIYGAESRRAISRLLRQFLDWQAITPTELLHNYRYVRLLELDTHKSPHLRAVERIADLQAARRGIDARERRAALQGLIVSAAQRARDAAAAENLPRLGKEGLAGLLTEAAARSLDPSQQAYLARHAIARALEASGSMVGKLEQVLGLAEAQDLPAAAQPIIDGLIADLLSSAAAVQRILDSQPNLGAALAVLADLATGRLGLGEASIPAEFTTLVRLLGQDPMPETRVVLIDRLQRELGGAKPLSREDKTRQVLIFDKLLDKLSDDHGLFVGGPATIEAVARRARHLDMVGGIEAFRFHSPDPVARLQQLLDAASDILADRQQQVLATYMVDILDRFDGDPTLLLPLRERAARAPFPAVPKRAVLDRLPQIGAKKPGA
jgi:hypothetical protein